MRIKPKILLVEDEESLARGLEYNLNEDGYNVEWVANGKDGLEAYERSDFDLIILDIMLPFMDGFEVAKKIRKIDPQIPILMLTARSSISDKITGLEVGADDYITKPFNLDELQLRVRGMLKRKEWYKNVSKSNLIFILGENEINFENLICKRKNKEFQLSQREAELIRYLIEHKNEVVTRGELLENVWRINPEIETRTIDIFIARLRKHFENDPSNPKYILSVRSVGYKLQDS